MTILKNNRYKTIHLSFCFIDNNEKDTYTYRFLLARILNSYTNKYQTKKDFLNALTNLYGAYTSAKINIMGQYSLLRVTLSFPNPKMIEDDLFEDQLLALVQDMLFNRTMFDKEIFNDVKRALIEQVETISERKYEYTKEIFMQHVFHDNAHAYPIYGSIEDIKAVDEVSLFKYYQEVLMKNQLKIYVSGDLSTSFEDKINKLSQFEIHKDLAVIKMESYEKTYTHHQMKLNMGQSFIFLSYNFDVDRTDAVYYAAVLASLMLSGFPDSILFTEFREKLGLAYEVDARFEYDKKTLFVFAGVNSQTVHESFDALKNIIEDFIKNGPTKDMLENAKNALVNQVVISEDYQQSFIPRKIMSDLYKFDSNITDDINEINQIKMEDVIEALTKIKLNTSFIVEGTSNES